MKSEAEYKLEIGLESLDELVKELDTELMNLDPYAGWAARIKLASIKGTIAYMKGGIRE